MKELRIQKASQAYQHELSHLLYFEIDNPHLTGISITKVLFTPDIKLAKIYFLCREGRDREPEIIRAFVRSKGFLRKELAQRVNLKYAPDLKFFYDDTAEVKESIDNLFKQIESERHG